MNFVFLWSHNNSIEGGWNNKPIKIKVITKNMEVYIMVIETNQVNGALVVYPIINGYLEQQVYIGYSKREAVKAFKQRYNLK